MWGDDEFQVWMTVTDQLSKLDVAARIRVLRYATDRLGLPLLLVKSKTIQVPDADRCEEIEAACLAA